MEALQLGPQCGVAHSEFLARWFGDEKPKACAKVPRTATEQTAILEATINNEPGAIVLEYDAQRFDGSSRKLTKWRERIRFRLTDESLRVESRGFLDKHEETLEEP